MKLTPKGQLTIPKKIRVRFGLDSNTEVDVVEDGNTLRIVKRGGHGGSVDRVYGILKNPRSADKCVEGLRGR